MPELAVLIPTRGRPGNVRKVISAWNFTCAWDVADMVLIVDADDPEYGGYQALFEETRHPDTGEALFSLVTMDHWLPMVHKLDRVAQNIALSGKYFALGFAGDDHLPQTIGWARRYVEELRDLGTGMVYSDDGYQGVKLSTEWAITADVVRALGRMVPAPVEHLYCDNSIMELFRAAGALKHLPGVRIEHMHPVAGKAETDDQYKRVNHRDQSKKDRAVYERWRLSPAFESSVTAVRELRKGRPDVPAPYEPPTRQPRVSGPSPRRVQRSGPSSARPRSVRPPRHFKNVRAATPEDVMVALADFASQVSADHEIVELGVFQGRTALQLAWGASLGNGAHVTAIDPWDLPGNVYDPPFTDAESRGWANHWVGSLGYVDKITLIQAFSHDVAARWAISVEEEGRDGQKVGLLYVDGDHTKEGAKRDIVSWAPHLVPGARIAVDDYLHPDWPGVGEAVDELVAEGFLAPVEVYHDRMAVTVLKMTTAGLIEETARQPEPDTEVSAPYQTTESSVLQPTAITSEGARFNPDPDAVFPAAEMAAAVRPEPVERISASGVPVPGSPVAENEVGGVAAGTEIKDLNLGQLRSLARKREIRLGARKDKKDLIIQALMDGK